MAYFYQCIVVLYTSKGSRCESVANLGGNTGGLVLYRAGLFYYRKLFRIAYDKIKKDYLLVRVTFLTADYEQHP